MSASFFTSQRLPISKDIMTHLKYLLGNIVFIRPADIDDRSQRSMQACHCVRLLWVNGSIEHLPLAISEDYGGLFKNSTAFLSIAKRSPAGLGLDIAVHSL